MNEKELGEILKDCIIKHQKDIKLQTYISLV
jgi:hypothetical protein